MNHINRCKLLYALYTPLQYLKLKLKGVKIKGFVYIGGNLLIEKTNSATITIGHNCRFMSKSWGNKIGIYHQCMLSVENRANLYIGDNCSFSGVSIWCFEKIVLGNGVRVGANVLIMDGDAHQDDPRSGMNRPIIIENNVWIGANVVVKKGVSIGRNSVIGMNSVVTKNIPANCIAIGNPCVVVKRFDKMKVQEIETYFQ